MGRDEKIQTLRCRRDQELAAQLGDEPWVQQVAQRVRHDDRVGPRGVRRQLLATSLRLTEQMSPELDAHMKACRARLGVDIPVESYVYPSSDFNAGCVKPESGRLFILFSSSLLEAFRGSELRFVIGHELGHHLFGHHDIPIGMLMQGKKRPPADLALKLFAWSRYAEISADRAGAACAEDADGAARSLFRLASGLKGDFIQIQLDDFLTQLEDMKSEDEEIGVGAAKGDWFSTHPFSPLRLRAIRFFNESVLSSEEGASVDVLETQVQSLMGLMEPGYLEENTDGAEAMRRLLFAAAIAVADRSDGISEAERDVFNRFFGEEAIGEDLDVEAVKADVENRISTVVELVPHSRRVQLLRDLCVVAEADTVVTSEEREVLDRIAEGLQVSPVVIDQFLNASIELD